MKATIGLESSSNLNSHSTGSADGELWLWGPQTNSYGDREWGINEGRYGCAYSIHSFYSRKKAVAELRKLRKERAEQANERLIVAAAQIVERDPATETEIATLWRKLPSVTREGKYFYRRGKCTVMQSWLSGRWNLEAGQLQPRDFATAQAAMDAADAAYYEGGEGEP